MQWQLLVACDMVWVALSLLGGNGCRGQSGAAAGMSPSHGIGSGWTGAGFGHRALHTSGGIWGDSDSKGPLRLCQSHLPAW